jgi:hypothetical protein
MADDSTGLTTERECSVFCRYLASQTPNSYVLGKYADGHRSITYSTHGPARPIDRLLLKLAVAHPLATRVADAYARVFTPRGILRHKLVLLLAILESCAPTHKVFDGPHRKGVVSLAFGFTGAAAGFAIAFVLACAVLLPIHAVLSISSRRRPTTSGALAGADHS